MANDDTGPGKTAPEKTGPQKRDAVRKAIDDNLRRVYQEILSEGTPPRFQALLDQLRKARPSDRDP